MMSYYEVLQFVSAAFMVLVVLVTTLVLFWFISKLRKISKQNDFLIKKAFNLKYTKTEEEDLKVCQKKDYHLAQGYLKNNQEFVVLKGSKAEIECKSKNEEVLKNWKKNEQTLLKENIIVKQDNFYLFQKDFIFPSCSNASIFILGNINSGWKYWRDTVYNKSLSHYFRINDPKDSRKKNFSEKKYQQNKTLKFALIKNKEFCSTD